jgi:hypothetical protein
VQESLEVVMVLSSLRDLSKNDKDKQIRKYHCNDFGNDQLWLAVPCNREVQPSCGSYVLDATLLIIRKVMHIKRPTYAKGSVQAVIILKAHHNL